MAASVIKLRDTFRTLTIRAVDYFCKKSSIIDIEQGIKPLTPDVY